MLKRIRKLYWLINSFIGRYKKIILITFAISTLLMISLLLAYPYIRKNVMPAKYIVGIVGLYQPSKLPLFIQQKLSSGFTKVDETGSVQPDIAESWEVNKDGTRYLFLFKNNQKWHDNESFTAYDVNYNFRDVVIAPADRYTLKLELNQPFSPLPSLLSRPLFKSGLIGLGEYKVSSIDLIDTFVSKLTIKKIISNGQNDTDDMHDVYEYKFFSSIEQILLAFKLGELDEINGLSQTYGLENEKNVHITKKVLTDKITAVFFNSKKSLFDQKEFRQALAYATPDFEGEKINSPISQSSWAYNPNVRDYSYNLELAKNYLSKSDYESSPSSSVTLSTLPELLNFAEKIAKNWNDLGVKTQVQVIRSLPDDFDALLGVQEIPSDPDQYQLWHSTQDETNITRYNNPKIDKLLEDGRKEQNKDERKKLYFDFQRFLVDDVPARFLTHPFVYTITRK